MNLQREHSFAEYAANPRAAGSSRNAAWASAPSRRHICWREQAAARPRGARTARPEATAFPGEGQARHLSSSWPARRATWSCSTTSRSWPSSTASCRRRNCSRATARPSSIPTQQAARARSSSSPRHGQCGAELSELLPHLADVADDIAIVKSMHTDAFNHAPAPDLDEHRLAAVRPAQLGRLDDLRPGQRVARPARASSSSAPAEGDQRRRVELGQRLSADGLPGRAVPQRRRPGSLSSRTRQGIDRQTQRDSLDAIKRLNKSASASSAIRKSPRASTPSKWPTACRPARPS